MTVPPQYIQPSIGVIELVIRLLHSRNNVEFDELELLKFGIRLFARYIPPEFPLSRKWNFLGNHETGIGSWIYTQTRKGPRISDAGIRQRKHRFWQTAFLSRPLPGGFIALLRGQYFGIVSEGLREQIVQPERRLLGKNN